MDNSREWTTKQAQMMSSIGIMNALAEKFQAWDLPVDMSPAEVLQTAIASIVMLEGQFTMLLMEDANLDFEQIETLVKKIKSI